MGNVLKIGISKNRGSKIYNINEVEAVLGRGIVNDRHFKQDNEKRSQITLIEIENINYYNKISKTSIPAINFRRNIVTQNVKLNELIGKKFFIGSVKVKGHDLCRPCKYLEALLEQKNIVKEFMHKGGLRCEILSSGKISAGDRIRQSND